MVVHVWLVLELGFNVVEIAEGVGDVQRAFHRGGLEKVVQSRIELETFCV